MDLSYYLLHYGCRAQCGECSCCKAAKLYGVDNEMAWRKHYGEPEEKRE